MNNENDNVFTWSNTKVAEFKIFCDTLYYLLDESVISEFDYGRLIGALVVTRGLDYSAVQKYVKGFEV